MPDESFGQALGKLIRRKRKAAGLTQLQLAEDAYENSGKVRRISELETGLVPNPHPATIDPVIVALGITEDELEECAKSDGKSRSTELDEAYRNARNLIESLARQFEHNNPDSTLGELDGFLREKSKEWRDLRAKIKSLEGEDEKVDVATTMAEDALNRGDFDQVDRFLQEAEEFHQQSKTVAAIKHQSAIRIARGDAMLMKGDADQALTAYRIAADFFSPFDVAEKALCLNTTAWRIYEISQRSVIPNFEIAVCLLRDLLQIDQVASDPHETSKANYRLGLVLRNLADQKYPDQFEQIINEATAVTRKAVLASEKIGDPFQQACAAVSLSNCLMAIGKKQKDVIFINEGIDALQKAKSVCENSELAYGMIQHVFNSLGSSMLYKADITNDEDEYDKVMHIFGRAVVASEENLDFEVWGGAKANVARLLVRKAQILQSDAHLSAFLRIRAICEYQSALEVYPETLFSRRFAEIQYELAGLLFHHAGSCDKDMQELYLLRSLSAYEVSGSIYSRDINPRRWAEINLYSASIFATHANLFEHARDHDIVQAVRRYGEAAQTFRSLKMLEQVDMCEKAIERVKASK